MVSMKCLISRCLYSSFQEDPQLHSALGKGFDLVDRKIDTPIREVLDGQPGFASAGAAS